MCFARMLLDLQVAVAADVPSTTLQACSQVDGLEHGTNSEPAVDIVASQCWKQKPGKLRKQVMRRFLCPGRQP